MRVCFDQVLMDFQGGAQPAMVNITVTRDAEYGGRSVQERQKCLHREGRCLWYQRRSQCQFGTVEIRKRCRDVLRIEGSRNGCHGLVQGLVPGGETRAVTSDDSLTTGTPE